MRPDLLTVREVAQIVLWSEEYVRRLARDGRIPGAVRWAFRWGFEPAAIRKWEKDGFPTTKVT